MFEYYILLNIEYYYHQIQEKIAKRDAKAILRLMIGVLSLPPCCFHKDIFTPQHLCPPRVRVLVGTGEAQGIHSKILESNPKMD